MRNSGRPGKRQFSAAIIIGLLSFALNLIVVPRTGFNPDESRWIHRAHFLSDLRHPFGQTWDDRYETRGQPPLGSYATALGLLLQGRDLDTNPPWDFGLTWERNIAIGTKPSDADLLAARRTNSLIAALTAAGLFVLLLRLTTPLGATAGALFMAAHPFNLYIGSIATADALLGLLIVASAIAAGHLADRPSWPNAFLLGLLLGLGGATKLSPLFVSLPLAVLGLALYVASRRAVVNPTTAAHLPAGEPTSDRHSSTTLNRAANGYQPLSRLPAKLIALPLIALIVFVSVYPFLWPDPVDRTLALFQFRVTEMRQQASDWPVMAVDSRAEALRRVGTNFSERFSFARLVENVLAQRRDRNVRLPEIELLLALIGLLSLAAAAIRARPSAPLLASLVLMTQAGITIGGMRSEFDRYHVPMMIVLATSIGLVTGGIDGLVCRLRSARRHARASPAPSHPVARRAPHPTQEPRRPDPNTEAGILRTVSNRHQTGLLFDGDRT